MTLDEAKAFLRVETVGEDAVIARAVASATGLCEAFLGQPLIRREVVESVRANGMWQRLGAAPVAAVTGVAEAGGAALPVADYAIDIDAAGDGWVRVTGRSGAVRVSYQAGLAADANAVPAAIAQGVTRLAAHLYANRDAVAQPPASIAALWRPFRRLRLGTGQRAC